MIQIDQLCGYIVLEVPPFWSKKILRCLYLGYSAASEAIQTKALHSHLKLLQSILGLGAI